MGLINYIFLTHEGYTFQPGSISDIPDIENMQVIGFSRGLSPGSAFQNLIKENQYLQDTSYDEVICYELSPKYLKTKAQFYLK